MASEQSKDPKVNEKIIAHFQQLRNEQRNLVNKINTLEMDLKEHKTVIETLQGVGEDRKCFRLIGGVLCERTVKEVLPQLIENKNYLENALAALGEELTKKGVEINKYREEHNIKIRGEQLSGEAQKSDDKNTEVRNVLVSSN